LKDNQDQQSRFKSKNAEQQTASLHNEKATQNWGTREGSSHLPHLRRIGNGGEVERQAGKNEKLSFPADKRSLEE
jgi:hypothetical protein